GPDDYAYRSEIENWNIRTFWCSESDTADSPTEFCYVQDAFDDDDPDLQRATAFVSGAPAMKRAIVARLLRRGLTLDDIVTNL
ncbi:MAG: hypothetical protein ABEL76_10015, partial [Bradymonadaceae bacterium]